MSDNHPTMSTNTETNPSSSINDPSNSHHPSSSPQVAPPANPSQLPPEAIALAGRLFDSARNGDTSIFEQVLTRSQRIANLTNEKGDSLIMLSSYHGHLPLTRLLLSHGADPNRLNERLQSPLAGAIFKGEDEIVMALLEGGADPRIGTPSALDAVAIFGQEGKWGTVMREKAKEIEGREEGNGHVNGGGDAIVEGEEIYEEARVSGE